jgi:hypothetical protein
MARRSCLSPSEILQLLGTAPTTVAKLRELDEHLNLCARCRAHLRSCLEGACAGAAHLLTSASDCPLDEDLVRYVQGRFSRAAGLRLEEHLASCAPCAAAVGDLIAFSQSATGTRSRRRPLLLLGVAAAVAVGWFGLGGIYQSHPSPERVAAVADSATVEDMLSLPEHGEARDRDPFPSPAQPRPSEPFRFESTTRPRSNAGPGVVVASLRDGDGDITLFEDGRLVGPANLSPHSQESLRGALRSGRLPATSGHSLVASSGELLGTHSSPDQRFALQSPIGTAVLDPELTLRWHPLDGALGYTVTIVDDESHEEVVESPTLLHPTWSMVDSPKKLERGKVYRWHVVAILRQGRQVRTPVPPGPIAKFRVLEAEAATRIREEVGRHPSSHLVRGVLYAEAGLLDEAEAELGALLKANPGSPLALSLMESLRAIREPEGREPEGREETGQ